MSSRPLKHILMAALTLTLVACGKPSQERGMQHTFSDEGAARTDTPTPEKSTSSTASTQDDWDRKHDTTPILERRDIRVENFEVPNLIAKKIEQAEPELLPKQSEGFKIFNQYFRVDTKTSVLTFAGVLRVPGKNDEEIELSCKIDQGKSWSCDNMFPTDSKIAAERRLQATARCVDALVCTQVGVKLFVLINGKIETQSFFSYKFRAMRSGSGDGDEEIQAAAGAHEDPAEPKKDTVMDPPQDQAQETPVVEEKPTPKQPDPSFPDGKVVASQDEPRELTLAEYEALLTRSEEEREAEEDKGESTTVAVSTGVKTPAPSTGANSIPDIGKQYPNLDKGVRDQAQGFHNRGSLKDAVAMTGSTGISVREGAIKHGTDLTIQMLKAAGKAVANAAQTSMKFVVTSISKQTGGHAAPHGSHQSGLDIDVAFPKEDGGTAGAICETVTLENGAKQCKKGSAIHSEFDEQRFFLFLKSFTCAQGAPTMAMFLDKEIKKHMCSWVKKNVGPLGALDSCHSKIFRALRHETGHYNHVHIRLRCPTKQGGCQENVIPLTESTGC